MSDYTNIYAGHDAIQVLPWVLTRVELLPAGAVPDAAGPILRAAPSSNRSKAPRLARALPAGFITGTFMELDIFDDAELAAFCGAWGIVASPYAGGISRACARVSDGEAEELLIRRAFDARGEELPKSGRVDCEGVGQDIWYDGLNGADRSLSFKSRLGGDNWMEAFNRDSSSKGSEVLNVYYHVKGGASPCTLVYVEEVRLALAIMKIAVLISGFLELAKGDRARALRLAVKYDDSHAARHAGSRPFEDALSLFMNTWFLHISEEDYPSRDKYKDIRDAIFLERFKTIEENVMLFADLCLSATPEPLVVHGGFRRGSLTNAKLPDSAGNVLYGNLLQAMAAQLYAYLNDGNPWKTCSVCGRPFKYEQQRMSPIASAQDAEKVYARRHRPAKTSFCMKRHEKRVYDKRNAEIRARKRASKEQQGKDPSAS